MNFLELAKERYSVRKFKDDPVDESIIENILKAGLVAPTARNAQPQKIIVVKSEAGMNALKKCTEYTFGAPLAFIVSYDKSLCRGREYDGKLSGDIDASIVTTHMMLEAWDEGIGSTWVMHFDPFALKREFELDENTEPVAVLVVGYAADTAHPSRLHLQFRDENEIISYK